MTLFFFGFRYKKNICKAQEEANAYATKRAIQTSSGPVDYGVHQGAAPNLLMPPPSGSLSPQPNAMAANWGIYSSSGDSVSSSPAPVTGLQAGSGLEAWQGMEASQQQIHGGLVPQLPELGDAKPQLEHH